MDSATHQRFIEQLCHWAATYIAQGRSPFRKAEAGSILTTAQGQLCPDMVLWINQDSFVAGGFIQIPDREDDLDAACACAESLGVNYFAIWGSKSLTIWQADSRTVVEQWPVPPLDQDSPRAYEMLLVQLMDEFRTLAVLGACPPDKLSHWHLTNLCQGTIAKATPLLSEHLRRTRNDQIKTIDAAEQQAKDKLTLTIARLLVLQYLQKLPYSIEPERLDQALKQFSAALEIPQLDQLCGDSNEADLDEQSQVLLHHLLRRLDQIGLFRHPQRAIRFIDQLLHATTSGIAPLEEASDVDILHVQCNRVSEHDGELMEVDHPQRLAFKYLLRTLNGWPHPRLCRTDLFNLPQESTPQHVAANLDCLDVPSTHYRNAWQAHINAAWSGRRSSWSRSTPTWCYQAFYLLGILSDLGTAHLRFPQNALKLPWADYLLNLLEGEYTIEQISQSDEQVILHVKRSHAAQQIALISGAAQQIEVTNDELIRAGASSLILRLQGNDQLLQLIDEKRLTISDSAPQEDEGLSRYRQSCLFLQLRDALLDSSVAGKHIEKIPTPSKTVLSSLASLELAGLPAGQQRSLIDRTLHQLLGIDSSPCQSGKTAPNDEPTRIDKKSLEEQIAQDLEVNGVPLFPDHYLYDFYRPILRSFHTDHRPWQLAGEFMGTFSLEDRAGNHCDCDNDLLTYAVLLTTQPDATLDLPTDPLICQQIVERHLADLVRLRHLIWDECHAALPTAPEANRLGNKIWKSRHLPPFKLVEEAVERFKLSQD